MAIPIAEIPGVGNVPGAVVGQYPGYRVNVGDIGPGPASANAGLARGAAAAEQKQISEGAFSAPGQAMEQAGYAVGQVSDVFSQLADQMANSKNYADVARAESIMDEARANHAMKMQTLPEDQWVSSWENEYRPEVEKAVAGLNLSPWAAERVNPQMIQFDAKTRTNIAYDAHKTRLSRDNQALLNRQNKEFEAGNFEGVALIQDMRVDAGHLTPEQREAETMEMQKTIRDRADMQLLNQTPSAAKDDLKEAMKTGESKMFPHLSGRPDLIRKNLSIAESNERNIQIAAMEELEDEIYSADGPIDPEDIGNRAIAMGVSPREAASLVAAASKVKETTPQGIAERLKVHSELMTRIEGYDPTTDPKAERYAEILIAIRHNMPEGLRESLTDAVRERRKINEIKPDAQIKSAVYRQIDNLASLGVYGKTKKKESDEKDDPTMTQGVFNRTLQLKQEFAAWHAANPKAGAAEVQQWFVDANNADILKNGVKISKEDRFNAWNLIPFVAVTNTVREGARRMTQGNEQPKSKAELMQEVDSELAMPNADDPNDIIP